MVLCMVTLVQNIIHVTLIKVDVLYKDIDKYKCGPAVTMLSDVVSPNAECTSFVLLLFYS